MPKIFAKSRLEVAAAVIAAVGGAATLAACGSDTATYKPAPRYTTTSPSTQPAPTTQQRCGTTVQPAPNTQYRPPATTNQPPPAKPGQAACGMGKCG